MNNYVQYGYKDDNEEFFITTDFDKQRYLFTKKEGEYKFFRTWGLLNRVCGNQSAIYYKNLAYYGITNRYDYWAFYIFEDTKTFCVERKKDYFEYSIYDQQTKEETKRKIKNGETVNEIDTPQITNNRSENEKKKIKDIVDKLVQKYKILYDKIIDKNYFLEEVKAYCEDYIHQDISAEEVEEFLVEGERFFVNFIDSEEWAQKINVEFIIHKYPYMKAYLGKINFLEILESEMGRYANIAGYEIEDYFCDLKEIIDSYISRLNWEKKRGEYNLNYILNKYDEQIEKIINKEKFSIELQKEIKERNKCSSEEMFFYLIEGFISSYIEFEQREYKKELFIKEYGSREITILLDEQKRNLFNKTFNDEFLSEKEKKEYKLYCELKQAYNLELYRKNGKTLKPSFKVIPQFISFIKELEKGAIKKELIEYDGECYRFLTFNKIKEFVGLFE